MMTNKEIWDNVADKWVLPRSRRLILDPALLKTCGEVQGKKIIDLGCGDGMISRALAEKGAKCVGVDISNKLILKAKEIEKENHLGISYFVAKADNLSEVGSDYNIIVMNMVICTIDNKQEIKKIFGEIKNVLSPEGTVIFSVLHPAFTFVKGESSCNILPTDYNYFNSGLKFKVVRDKSIGGGSFYDVQWTLSDYAELLREEGYVIIDMIEPKPIPAAEETDPEWFEKKSKFPRYLIFKAKLDVKR